MLSGINGELPAEKTQSVSIPHPVHLFPCFSPFPSYATCKKKKSCLGYFYLSLFICVTKSPSRLQTSIMSDADYTSWFSLTTLPPLGNSLLLQINKARGFLNWVIFISQKMKAMHHYNVETRLTKYVQGPRHVLQCI